MMMKPMLWLLRHMMVQPKANNLVAVLLAILFQALSNGNNITSLMDLLSVKIMTSLSTPMPSPPAGGIPCSRALIKSKSIFPVCLSSSSVLDACCLNLDIWSFGSISSENAFATSSPPIKSSNLSVSSGFFGCFLASGDISIG